MRLFKKAIFALSLLFVMLLAVSSVSAADNMTENIVSIDNESSAHLKIDDGDKESSLTQNTIDLEELEYNNESDNNDSNDVISISADNPIISDDFTIDPQKVKNKDLTRTTFSGVKLIGSFDNTIINGTNFNNCQTELVLDLNKINPGCKKVLKYNKFGGITFKGDLSDFELDSNDFTNSKNAIIDFDNSAYIHISSKGNIFSDVTFRNIRRVSDHFLFDNRNNFTNATISYNSYNCEYELNWYNKIKNSKNFKDIILINEDRELEEEVKQIINPEITKQKIKKMESN